MTEKVQLLHPAGKKMARIDEDKYELLRDAVLACLSTTEGSTHRELHQAVLSHLKKHRTAFSGSVEWYMESVKLDLEARGPVVRESKGGRPLFRLA